MNICNNHLFGLVIVIFVVVSGIVSTIRRIKKDEKPMKGEKKYVASKFYLKQKGGDPRNHEWYEVSETMYDMVTGSAMEKDFFQKPTFKRGKKSD